MLPQLAVDVDFQLPRLADSLDESTVSRWLKKTGDRVTKGEPLVEIVVPDGTTAAVGTVIARLSES